MAYSSFTWQFKDVGTSTRLQQMNENTRQVRILHRGSSAPSEAEEGVRWLDTGASNRKDYIHDGTQWVQRGTLDPTNHKYTPFGGGWTYLSTATLSNDATVDFINMTGYDHYAFVMENVRPDGTGAKLTALVSSASDASSFYGANYRYVHGSIRASDATFGDAAGDDSHSAVVLTHNVVVNSDTCGLSGLVWLFDAQDAAQATGLHWNLTHGRQGGTTSLNSVDGAGAQDALGPSNSLRFLFDTANLAGGRIHLYGLATS